MPIEADARQVLKLLAERPRVEGFPDDETQASTIAQATGLSPSRLDDAVSTLVDAGLVKTTTLLRTDPYAFTSAQILPRGRLEYERSVARRSSLWAIYKQPEDPPLELAAPMPADRASPDARPASERRLFICHAELDKEIAACLKDYFEAADQPIDVFVASHREDMPGGAEWWNRILGKLKSSTMVLTVVSPRSRQRPWLYFESGGAHLRDITVIPLAVPPESKSLPPPLGMLQGYDLGSVADVRALVGQLRSTFNLQFARRAEELSSALSAAFSKVGDVNVEGALGSSAATPLEVLRRLVTEKGTVRVYPVVPFFHANDVFEVSGLSQSGTLDLCKQSSQQHVFMPTHRIVGISEDGSGHVLEINGRIQWVDEDYCWKFMQEAPNPSDPHGLVKDVARHGPEVRRLKARLMGLGWQVMSQPEWKAKSDISADRQLVYANDGRYLRVPGRPYNSVMVKRRAGTEGDRGSPAGS